MANFSNIITLPQVLPQVDEILIFDISGQPTFMFDDGRFWVSLTTMWKWLGDIERAYLLSCELRALLNDKDGGTYVSLDDFLSISPADVRIVLIKQKNKMIAMMQEAEAGK